ncbi:sensor histidine kinase [Microbacterium sp. NPDC090007]|uniref:sensor histidine kinase n=1 Tax=Microbacterium sp. NPDC090007 TaxID=3364204 RepID=UPI00380FEEB5
MDMQNSGLEVRPDRRQGAAGSAPAPQLGEVLASGRARVSLAVIVFLATTVQVLSNPLAVLIDETPWQYPIPLAVVTIGCVLACAVQAAALLLSGTRPGLAAVVAVLAYVAVAAVFEVPTWVAAMPLVVAVAMFLQAARKRAGVALSTFGLVVLIAAVGLFGWSLSTGASLGVIWAFLLQSIVSFAAPVAGATALGIWWERRSARVRAVHDAAEASAREVDERVENARVHERGRIARELHDVAGQHLAGMLSLADAAVEIEIRDTRQAVELIEDMRSEGKFASASLYAALRDLDAVDHSAVERTPDVRSLPELESYWTKRGMRLRTQVCGDVDGLPAAVSTASYRAVQEALTNCAKHAAGAAVAVDVVVTAATLRATIVNGPARVATEPSADVLSLGWGLDGLQDRLRMLNGSLTAFATPEGGWLMKFSIPLHDQLVGHHIP